MQAGRAEIAQLVERLLAKEEVAGSSPVFRSMNLHEGQQAPDFTLPDQNGTQHSLKQYRGSWVLLYFYPKDDTPGCTQEACTLRDNFPHFQNLKAVVLGISVDSVAKHKKFADKYELPFTLLADEQKTVVEQYGVWGQRSFVGIKYDGISRTSFLINPEGMIAKIYYDVEPASHATEVLRDIEQTV